MELEYKLQNFPTMKNLMQNYINLDIDDIKSKILDIQRRALKIYPYNYIKTFEFLTPRASFHPMYKKIIENSEEKRILDIGCGLGTDIRQFIFDGVKRNNITGLEIKQEYVNLGFELFGDQSILKDNFIIGDILNKNFPELNIRAPFNIIFTGSVIHLLTKKKIELFLKIVYDLLSENGIFFGRTSALQKPEKLKRSQSHIRYLHSPDTLKSTFKKYHFKNIQIEVSARFVPDLTNQDKGYILSFTVSK